MPFQCLQFSRKNELKILNFCLSLLGRHFAFIFWENWKRQKSPFEINWLLILSPARFHKIFKYDMVRSLTWTINVTYLSNFWPNLNLVCKKISMRPNFCKYCKSDEWMTTFSRDIKYLFLGKSFICKFSRAVHTAVFLRIF